MKGIPVNNHLLSTVCNVCQCIWMDPDMVTKSQVCLSLTDSNNNRYGTDSYLLS